MKIFQIFELNTCYRALFLVTIFTGIIIGQLIYISNFIPNNLVNSNKLKIKAEQKRINFRYEKNNIN